VKAELIQQRLSEHEFSASRPSKDFVRRCEPYRPGFAPYLCNYAVALAAAGEPDRALESAEAAARADPNLAEAHMLSGALLARKRQLAEAAREYQEAIRLRPDVWRARLELAAVLAPEGEIKEAVEQLREAAKGSDPGVARLAADALERITPGR
jgi:tetratricopeptide (TPR) repeat protein